MRKLEFYKLSPGGNTTILITSPIIKNSSERASLANILMDELHLHAEQVGYVTKTDDSVRLDMMGGEFCGNASRSLAAMLAFEDYKGFYVENDCYYGQIEVSGVSRPLQVKIEKSDDTLNASVEMPIDSDTNCIKNDIYEDRSVDIVRMEGISHVLINEDIFPFPDDYVKRSASIRKVFELTQEEAVGCIWYKEVDGRFEINPVVWVRGIDSTYYETACGSGTVALGLLISNKKKDDIDILIGQPSKEDISAKIDFDKKSQCFKQAWIGGQVKIIARGETYIY